MDDLLRLINGYQLSQAIHVAATLGIADRLAGGARDAEDLAVATDAHAPALYRLLRALAAVGILHEDADHRFALTPLGEGLRTDVPDSAAGWAAFIGRPYHWSAWSQLLHSVRTGENAFAAVHGVDVWTYRAEHPEESGIFDAAMTALAARVTASVLAAYDFGQFEVVADIGGSRGTLLAAILAHHPHLRGILFDRPGVVAGVDLGERCRIVGGSFFEAVPGGADAYILKSVLHDWDDETSVAILQSIRRAAPAGSAVLILERRLGPPNAEPAGKLSDLNMLVATGGRERTRDEYARLLEAAGYGLVSETPAGPVSVFEAR
ncbi:acetylserotonin O-methyltransferase [Solirubrobacter ginsenosidimutans]|uniref:Acetylserotonin O-methyltransferase n=1 Tax=Solirubrobacter ginsenosidimutans TaxID=490573 RepID=A0A9X3S4Z8_9ACTN|nr:methyltransferase [Solirubrobacter ginsenosidimutans]MDA0165032.1 acetylserotonin O-methyltransferase [Solirubrobacter ginsenosidimutans]